MDLLYQPAYQLAHQLAYVDPRLIAGLLSRGIAGCLLIVFVSLYPQLIPIAGQRGLMPVADAYRAIARDFSAPKRFAYFPSLLWFSASDRALHVLGALGIAAASLGVIGGPWSPCALAVCYVVYLSLDRAMTLVYPWDSLLFEAAFWGVFLPPTLLLPELEAVNGAAPAVLWVFRLLMFRVLFGFGKHKFLGSTPQDSGFLQGFFATQPLPTRFGWWAQKLPLGLLKLSLLGMFVIEMIAPFAVFFPGEWSAVLGLGSIGLMFAIWLTGNFGHFNLALMVVSLAAFDTRGALQLSVFATPITSAAWWLDALFVFHSALALVALPFNTFCSFAWMMWSPWLRVRPAWLTAPVDLARLVQPFRIVHAYGVFSPLSGPSSRVTAVAEASWDGSTWHELKQPFWITQEQSVPKFCAPHHERFDQAVVYESIGLNESSPYRNILGRWDPYGHGGQSVARTFLQRVLRADLPGTRFYDRSLERQWGPPRHVRARTYLLEPASFAELRASKRWWRRTLVGPHFPVQSQEPIAWDDMLPNPELWHYDDLYWLRRSRLGALLARAARGEDAHSLVRADAPELTAEDVTMFWETFVPFVHTRHHASFQGLRASVGELRKRHDAARLKRFERLANRYALCLFAKLEPEFLSTGLTELLRGEAAKFASSHYELRTLCLSIVAEGREAFDRVLGDPQLAAAHAASLTMFKSHQLQAVFRYETFVYHSQKLRLLDKLTGQQGRRVAPPEQQARAQKLKAIAEHAWGSLPFIEFLKTQFCTGEDVLDIEENWPTFAVTPEATIIRLSAEPEPARRVLELADDAQEHSAG